MLIILDESKESLLETHDILQNFSEMSGLHINLSKTPTVRIGSKKYSDEVLFPNIKVHRRLTYFILLGIHFDVDLEIIPKINYDLKLIIFKSLLNQWGKIHVTPIGKIIVIKALVLPW